MKTMSWWLQSAPVDYAMKLPARRASPAGCIIRNKKRTGILTNYKDFILTLYCPREQKI